jgi:hypothetical protein
MYSAIHLFQIQIIPKQYLNMSFFSKTLNEIFFVGNAPILYTLLLLLCIIVGARKARKLINKVSRMLVIENYGFIMILAGYVDFMSVGKLCHNSQTLLTCRDRSLTF